MAESLQQTTAATSTRPSVRAGLLACVAISLLVLWIAAFEMPFADLSSGFVLFPVLPVTALAFLACCLWSVFLLERGALLASPPKQHRDVHPTRLVVVAKMKWVGLVK